MTSSDETALPPAAVDHVAARVGTSVVGRPRPGVRLGVACAKFNGGVTFRLLDGLLAAAEDHQVKPSDVSVVWVPGAFELPLAARALIAGGSVDAVAALGAVIRGDTAHFDHVAGQCAAGLQRVALDTGVPVVFGVLTTDTVAQAMERAGGGEDNKGYEAGVTALEMADLLGRLASGAQPAKG